jgi:ABC-type sugar transport system permease subunit
VSAQASVRAGESHTGTGAPTPSRAGATAPARRRRARHFQPAWLFMAPSLIILGVFVIYPMLRSLQYSFYNWTVGAASQEFTGAANYVKLLHDSQFWNALRVTLELTLVSVVLLIVLGLVAGLLLQRNTWAHRIVRSAFFFPTVVALSTMGIVWRFLLDPDIGIIGGLFSALGLPRVAWLQSEHLALPTVIFVYIWKYVGYAMILLLGGLNAVPQERYEAAQLDRASRWQTLRYITLPGIRPTMLFTSLILTIQSFEVFDLVYAMTTGGPVFHTDTLVNMLYRVGFTNFETGYASAISWVLFIIILAVSLLQLKFFRYDDVD